MKRLLLCTLPLLALVTACESPAPAGPTAECPVCDREGDLACLRVTITPDTPSVDLDGTRLWFCSEECRTAFLRDPQRYRRP